MVKVPKLTGTEFPMKGPLHNRRNETHGSARMTMDAALRKFDGALNDDERRDAAHGVIANAPQLSDLREAIGVDKADQVWSAAGRELPV